MIETLLGIACFLLLVLCIIEWLKLEQAGIADDRQRDYEANALHTLYEIEKGTLHLRNIYDEVNTIRVKV